MNPSAPKRSRSLATLLCLAGVAALVALQTGCASFTWSSNSVSRSVDWSSGSASRSLDWSSDSSSGDSGSSAYLNDVQDYAASFATSDGDPRVFQRDVSAIAQGYGITDWERERATYVAIGRGLARSGARRDRCDELAVSLVDEDPARLAWVRAGYEAPATR